MKGMNHLLCDRGKVKGVSNEMQWAQAISPLQQPATEREVADTAGKGTSAARKSQPHSGYASRDCQTTAPKAAKAQSLFKTEPWECVMLKCYESNAAELLSKLRTSTKTMISQTIITRMAN